jgi:predicted transcriptional regulator
MPKNDNRNKIADLIALVLKAPSRSVLELTKLSELDRTAISRWMRALEAEGIVKGVGNSQSRRYYLCLFHRNPEKHTGPRE